MLWYISCWIPSRNSSSAFAANLLGILSVISSFLVLKIKLASPFLLIPTSYIRLKRKKYILIL